MKRSRKWFLLAVAAALVCLMAFSAMAAETDHGTVTGSGVCGPQTTWKFYSDGTLIISGSGEIYDRFDFSAGLPWKDLEFTTLIIESGVTRIGNGSFHRCASLRNVYMDDTVTEIGMDAFCWCVDLSDISIPDSVKSIGNSAFAECTALSYIRMSDNIEYIGKNVFDGTLWLEKYPEGTVYTGNALVGYKGDLDSLTDCNIRPGTRVIAPWTFRWASKLTSVTIPDSVLRIGEFAFSESGLQSLVIPDSVQQVDPYALSLCEDLTSVTCPAHLLTYTRGYNGEWLPTIPCNLEQLTVSSGAIPQQTFYPERNSLASASSVTLREGVRSIGAGSFYGSTKLREITIPATVTSIDFSAFADSALTAVFFKGGAPAIAEDAFEGATAYAVYSEKEASWTQDKFQTYGGNLTWVAQERAAIAFDQTRVQIIAGQTASVPVHMIPHGVPQRKVTYTIGNGAVARVDQKGLVTALKPGNTWLHAETADGLHVQCLIQVQGIPVSKVTYPYSEKIIYVGRPGRFCPNVYPSNAANKTLTYRVGNTGIATVDRYGNLKGLKVGNTWLYATSHNGKQIRVLLRVLPVSVESVTYPYSTKLVRVGTTALIHPNVQPADATNKTLKFRVGNPQIATVDRNGYIRGLHVGNTWLYATAHNGKQLKILVQVLPDATAVLVPSEQRVSVGSTVRVTAKLIPDNAYPEKITYAVGNSRVATVDSRGNVRGVGVGNTWLTVRTASGKTDRCLIRVVR